MQKWCKFYVSRLRTNQSLMRSSLQFQSLLKTVRWLCFHAYYQQILTNLKCYNSIDTNCKTSLSCQLKTVREGRYSAFRGTIPAVVPLTWPDRECGSRHASRRRLNRFS